MGNLPTVPWTQVASRPSTVVAGEALAVLLVLPETRVARTLFLKPSALAPTDRR